MTSAVNNNYIPQRMCVVCRVRKPKTELLRAVLIKESGVSFDLSGKGQGRGAYVCNNEGCLAKLTKQRGFNRSFKREVGNEVYIEITKGQAKTGN